MAETVRIVDKPDYRRFSYEVAPDYAQTTKEYVRKTEEVAEVAGCPCDTCPNFNRCKTEEIACEHYVKWQVRGKKFKGEFCREPNKHQYKKLLA